MPFQFGRVLRHAVLRQIIGRGDHFAVAVEKGAHAQGRIVQPPRADGDIDPAFNQVDAVFRRGQRHVHLRITAAKRPDERHKAVQHQRGGGIDTQQTLRHAACRADFRFRLRHVFQNLFGAAEILRAFFGGADLSRGAVEQSNAELGFQPLHTAADGRIVGFQHCRRAGKATVFHHGNKKTEVV